MKYDCESSVEKCVDRDGKISWIAFALVSINSRRKVTSAVDPIARIASVEGVGRADIGEPWPDPTTPVGLERLMVIAEGLAVTEWERRFGADK